MRLVTCILVIALGMLIGCSGEDANAARAGRFADPSEFGSRAHVVSEGEGEELAARMWLSQDPSGIRRLHLEAFLVFPEGVQGWKHYLWLSVPVLISVDQDGVVRLELDPDGSDLGDVTLADDLLDIERVTLMIEPGGLCEGSFRLLTDAAPVDVQISGALDRVVCDRQNGVTALELGGGVSIPCTHATSD